MNANQESVPESVPISFEFFPPNTPVGDEKLKDVASHAVVETRIWQACKGLGFKVHAYFESKVTGGDGNREFFVWASPPGEAS